MPNTTIQGLPDPAVDALLHWWGTLIIENPSSAARADRSALRRAGDLMQVACLPNYQRVYRSMVNACGEQGTDWNDAARERIAAAVALLAHVRGVGEKPLAQAMGPTNKKNGERNPVSELRFRRLLESDDITALFIGLRRALPLVDYRAKPRQLAKDIFFWGDEVRKRWAYDYDWSH